MTQTSDRPFDWVAAMAIASGAAVLVPSLLVLGISLVTVLVALF